MRGSQSRGRIATPTRSEDLGASDPSDTEVDREEDGGEVSEPASTPTSAEDE
jgi:hypothetical protein